MASLHFPRIDSPSVVVRTNYPAALTSTSKTYSPDQKGCLIRYYEALKIGVTTGGHYSIRSNSSVDMYGYIYNGTFDPFEPSRNLIAHNGEGCGNGQFGLRLPLSSSTAYILVATTAKAMRTGSFTIIVSGPASVHMNRTSEFLECTANATWKNSLREKLSE